MARVPVPDAEAPTNPTDLLDFPRDHWGEGPGPFGPSELGLLELLTQPILTPQQRAATYEAASRLAAGNAHIRLAPDIVDATGRHGVGIVVDEAGFQRTTFILDKDSYEPLGYERVVINSDGLPAELQNAPELQPGSGTALAIVEQGVANSVDERP